MEFDLFEPSLLREKRLPLAALTEKKAAWLRGLVVDKVCSRWRLPLKGAVPHMARAARDRRYENGDPDSCAIRRERLVATTSERYEMEQLQHASSV
jgi:hypothetical protein